MQMVASLAITYRLVGWYISGPVAKLPFEPAWLLKKLAHRGLDSPAANDCAFVRPPSSLVLHAVVVWDLSSADLLLPACHALTWSLPQCLSWTGVAAGVHPHAVPDGAETHNRHAPEPGAVQAHAGAGRVSHLRCLSRC